jgi:hypothetical protein
VWCGVCLLCLCGVCVVCVVCCVSVVCVWCVCVCPVLSSEKTNFHETLRKRHSTEVT